MPTEPSSYLAGSARTAYCALEPTFAALPGSSALKPTLLSSLLINQSIPVISRRDKTGSQTLTAAPAVLNAEVSLGATAPLAVWGDGTGLTIAPLVSSFFGESFSSGGLVIASCAGTAVGFASKHNLRAGVAIAVNGEIRFVVDVPDSQTVSINAPFGNTPAAGTLLGTALTMTLSSSPSSFSLAEFWAKNQNMSRIVLGAKLASLQFAFAGTGHTVALTATGSSLVDSGLFQNGSSGLSGFPTEPQRPAAGPVRVGPAQTCFLGAEPLNSVTSATVDVKNGLTVRNRDFGLRSATAITSGARSVEMSMNLIATTGTDCWALYSLAAQQQTAPLMLQVGNRPGATFAVYMPRLRPKIPAISFNEGRIAWTLNNEIAQGSSDDEIVLALA